MGMCSVSRTFLLDRAMQAEITDHLGYPGTLQRERTAQLPERELQEEAQGRLWRNSCVPIDLGIFPPAWSMQKARSRTIWEKTFYGHKKAN